MKSSLLLFLSAITLILTFSFSKWNEAKKPRVLVFSKTAGYRHGAIQTGKTAILKLGNEQGYLIDTTENANYFTEDSLKNYAAVIFLNTTGNVLNSAQEAEFKRYIQAGGGFVGVHAASDTEYDWPWYGKLVGAYFLSHPTIQQAVLNVTDSTHISTKHLPKQWTRKDEWYNFKELNKDVKVLISIDEGSYKGGKNGNNHPVAWYHDYDGGRAFYTALGHTAESYTEPLYIQHLAGGIKYAIGNNVKLNYSRASTSRAPEENRFVKSYLTQGTLSEPTEMAILPNLDILVVQRRGEIMLYKNETKEIKQAGSLNVYFSTGTKVNAEEGLLGVAADPAFEKNNYVYLFYSPADTSVNRLSRFKLVNDKIDNSSEKIILQFYSQRQICCHTGGSIAFGPDGLLYVSTGDNTTPFNVPGQTIVNKGFAPLDNRPGLHQYDAGRSSGNTNDLRGKILRIRIKEDGTYEIPEGNLFPLNTPKTRPEIYVMGTRNAYRISVDKNTSFLYWGDVGPDSRVDDPQRGPRGYDEVNQARKAGYFGWPFFVGKNYPYHEYDYITGTSGATFNPDKPINNSPNNTGLTELPAVEPPFIWYPYNKFKEFPELGEGSRSAMAGPVYYSDLYPKHVNSYPDFYNGKLFIYDLMRGWIKAISLKENGDIANIDPFMPSSRLTEPIDFEVGPDGRFYILEYGTGWFTKNPDAGIVRIDYLAGNRPPKINKLIVSKTSGLLPYKLSATVEAVDYDKDQLTYIWNLGKGITKTTTKPSIQYTYTKAGEYPISVRVMDNDKASSQSSTINVYAGNEHPNINILVKGNRSFYFPGKPVNYQVIVSDKGSAVNQKNIYVSNKYTQGADIAAESFDHQVVAENLIGQSLMLKSDCKSCHQVNAKSIGPSFTQISTRYQKDTKAIPYLVSKITKGGAGAWGEIPMPPHNDMTDSDVKKIAEWVMSLSNTAVAKPSLPLSGKIIPGIDEKNTLVLNVAYTDLGAVGVKPLSAANAVYLKNNSIDAGEIKEKKDLTVKDSSGVKYLIFPVNTGWLKISKIDLSGISNLELVSLLKGQMANYTIEVRLDSEKGNVIGKSEIISSENQQLLTKIVLQPVNDHALHDLYLVIRSNKTDVITKPVLPLLKTLTFNSI